LDELAKGWTQLTLMGKRKEVEERKMKPNKMWISPSSLWGV